MTAILKNDLLMIFREVFNDNNITISEKTTADDIKNWNSLSNMLLLTEIENHFNIKFSFKEVRSFKNVGDLIITIEQHLRQ